MGRWEQGSTERLRMAAMELYVRQGFEQTTVAEIAAAAGLTERTFFRHFSDKREVLFNGQDQLEQLFVDGLGGAPDDASPFDIVAAALAASAGFFADERRWYSQQRQTVIDANPALQERELLKMTTLGVRLAAGLRSRGVPEPTATLAARTGVTVFSVSFGLWVSDGETRSLAEIERAVLDELAALTGAAGPA